jgi:DivIVA domain-containing protein
MSDLDLPLLPSAEQIRRRQFATVRRGYDPDQVHDYLNQVAQQVEALEGELREQRLTSTAVDDAASAAAASPMAASAPAGAEADAAYDRIGQRLANVLRAADEEAQTMIDQARTEAEALLGEARAEAERMRTDARSRAEEDRARSGEELQRARAEADRVLGGLEHRRESLLGQMHEMQSRLLAVAQNLEIPDGAEEADAGTHVAHEPAQVNAWPFAPGSSDAEPHPPVDVGVAADESRSTREAEPAKEPEPERSPEAKPAPVSVGQGVADDDAVDPRYEDMWATPGSRSVDIPDLSSLDIDFDDEPE